MELRRAILLFAIVLGLAAVATSVSRPPAEESEAPPPPPPAESSTPTAEPRPQPTSERPISFDADARGLSIRSLPAGSAATITVKVPEPGEVTIEGLGLSAPGEPLTPARFEVLAAKPDRHRVRFTPVGGGGEARTVGLLQVTP